MQTRLNTERFIEELSEETISVHCARPQES